MGSDRPAASLKRDRPRPRLRFPSVSGSSAGSADPPAPPAQHNTYGGGAATTTQKSNDLLSQASGAFWSGWGELKKAGEDLKEEAKVAGEKSGVNNLGKSMWGSLSSGFSTEVESYRGFARFQGGGAKGYAKIEQIAHISEK